MSVASRFTAHLRVAQRAIAAIAIIAIAVFLARHRLEVFSMFARARVGWLALGGSLFPFGHALVASGFHQVHRAMGIEANWPTSIDSYLRRLPARYVPGGLWHSLARYLDLHDSTQIGGRALLRVFAFESGVVGVSGLFVALLAACIFGPDNAAFAFLRWPLAWAAIALALGLGGFARWTGQRLDARQLVFALVLHTVNWIWLTFAFAVYARGLGGGELDTCAVGDVAVSYLLATVTGFLSFFAPQGWGVAETVFATLHPCSAAAAVAVAALTGFRVICLVADAALFALWMVLRRLNPMGRRIQ
ncbi:MAG: hypothetical protein ABI843_14405 [Dokdonella sp.]